MLFIMKIALFLKSLDEEYQLSIFKGIKTEAAALNMDLICIQGEIPPEKSAEQEEFFPSRHLIDVDGILFLSSVFVIHSDLNYQNKFKNAFPGIPFVSIGEELSGYYSIRSNTEKPMSQLMEHLIVFHGYRKLLFIGGPAEHQDNIIRENIFRTALEKYRPSCSDLEGTVTNGEFLEISGMIIIRDYMRRHPDNPPDVIVAGNDNTAIGVRNMLLASDDPRWKTCPVTGFDDISQSRLEVPALTTIRQPLDELGRLAVRTLQKLIMGKEAPLTITAEASLIIRSSCGCNPSSLPADNGNDFNLSKEEYRDYANQFHLRYLSLLGQSLVVINTYEEMIDPLRFILTNLEVSSFFLILYDHPRLSIGAEGKLLYERTADRDVFYGDNPPHIKLDWFIQQLEGKLTWCLVHLLSGKEYLGLVVYDGPDMSHPQMYNGLILLTNTVKRLFSYQDEMDRASQLEKEVASRTRDLVKANEKIWEEVKRRLDVEAEVLRISEMERLRFSMDLHDDICQRLAGISMYAKSAAGKQQVLEELSQLVDETLQRTRQYAHDSFPMELDTLGLRDSLEALCSGVNKQTHCECIYSWDAGEKSPLTQSQDINVYRIIQEALHNAVKHARANRITVTVCIIGSAFSAVVEDNGTGNPELSAESRPAGKGLGLRSMRYRAHQAGADYSFESREIGGTMVRINIPLVSRM